MDARALLRQYLEQRRELGESEFVLDNMSVEDALTALGASRRGGAPADVAAPSPSSARRLDQGPTWQEMRAQAAADAQQAARADVRPETRPDASRDTTRSAPATPAPAQETDMPKRAPAPVAATGIHVGSPTRNMFSENPFAALDTLDAIASQVRACTRCELYKTATNAVPGEGNPNADFMCVGEAPGANEDQTGRPFVGAAGQLLTKILGAINLQREDVYIANVLKHRPPGNRNPKPEEVVACSPYLVRQIELIKPKVIVAFGTFAAQTLLDTKTPIGKLRGAVHKYHGVPLVVTYHQAALLRNPAWKRPTWEDVQLARKILDGQGA